MRLPPATRLAMCLALLAACGDDLKVTPIYNHANGRVVIELSQDLDGKQLYVRTRRGKFDTLEDALMFYVTRDTNPTAWYPSLAEKFNDLPAKYRGNVNQTEVPYNRKLGDDPALSPSEIDDVIAFLNTLTDADLLH